MRKAPSGFTILLIGCMLLVSPTAALGQDPGTPPATSDDQPAVSFGVQPAGGADLDVFRVDLAAGESTVLQAEVSNRAATPIELETFLADVVTKVNGGFSLATEGSSLHEPTTWMEFTPESFTVQPGEVHDIAIPVSVPEGTAPGQYVNGFAVRTAESFEVPGSSTFRQVIQKNAGIVITVPGPVTPSFELGEPRIEWTQETLTLTVPVRNTGNVLVGPSGTVSIKSPEGVELVSGPVGMQSVYMGHATTLQVDLGSALLPGEYRLTLELADERDGGSSASLVDVPVEIGESPMAESVEPADPVTFAAVSIEPNANPVQFVAVSADVLNTGEALAATRVILVVSRDGEHVEDYVLAGNVPLPVGTSTFSQRYIPLDGFEPGAWTFSLKIDVIGDDGLATPLQTSDPVTIDVP